MALIDHIDGPNRDIYLSASTVGASIHPIDIYKEMRTLRKDDEGLRKYDVFLSAYGNVAKGGGKFTERYVQENLGTRIIPYDTSHTLTVTGTIITDDGQEGIACFDRFPLTSTTIVDINYIPPQVEIIQIISGSGVTLQDKTDIIDGVWNTTERTLTSSGSITAGDIENIVDAVLDESLEDHIGEGSVGRSIKYAASATIRDPLSRGGTLNTLIMDVGASADDGAYNNAIIAINAGKGTGQVRTVLSYDGTSKEAFVNQNWGVIPDETSNFVILAGTGVANISSGRVVRDRKSVV